MKVYYIRDRIDNSLAACIVGLDAQHIGVAVYSPKGQFKRENLRQIALDRAAHNQTDILFPDREVAGYFYSDIQDKESGYYDYFGSLRKLIEQRVYIVRRQLERNI